MSLLGDRSETERNKPVRGQVYNADWTYGPAGGITASEFTDIKEGDVDRETGARRCVFCRQAKSLTFGLNDCCSGYCEKQEHGWVPWGKQYPGDDKQKGRGWLSL